MSDEIEIVELEESFYGALVPGMRQRKIAWLIATVCAGREIPSDDIVAAALHRLADRSDVKTFGIIHHWRHSEIKRLIALST